jgi:hypothetical protein
MIITPDFLDVEDFNRIKNVFFDCNFPWYYHSSVDFDPNKYVNLDNPWNFQFVHSFYSNYAPNSQYIEILAPILKKLNPAAIVKIKANLQTRTEKIVEYNMHSDTDLEVKCKTSILYINSNDGYTKFESGETVISEENKLITFDSDRLHTGSSCTTEKCRIVLNLNYY